MRKKSSLMIVLLVAALWVIACAGTPEPPPAEGVSAQSVEQPAQSATQPVLGDAPVAAIAQNTEPTNEATLNAVDIAILESFPVQVNVTVRGSMPDTCVSLGQVGQTRNGDTFMIAIGTLRTVDAACVTQVQSFETVVPLDVVGLPAGTYTVTAMGVNSISSAFTLSTDNSPIQPAASPELVDASISGIVWHDACSLLADGSPAAGCVTSENGAVQANGTLDSGESRIAGVELTLQSGLCPGEGAVIGQAITSTDGEFLFTALRAGTYCVSINPSSPANTLVLQPGNFTYPGVNVGSSTVTLAQNDFQTVDFGWDYQFDAPPPAQPVAPGASACTDAAGFVADVTIPDNTPLAPGEAFVKTWRVRNEGTCTWETTYNLVFAGDNAMSGPNAVPFPQTVPPGGEVDLSVSLVAPVEAGTHRGDWKFQNAQGVIFGSRGDYPLYVQIVVNGQ